MLARLLIRSKKSQCPRRLFSCLSERVVELDRVLLRHSDARKTPIFTKPLSNGQSTSTRFGRVQHDAIIGLRERDLVATDKGTLLRVHHPSLVEHIELIPRMVTPIYPAYASLITSLLDIHLTPPTPSSSADPVSPTFEILEAGTGHGGLTLYLARALTAGNPPVPAPIQSQINSSRPNPLSSPSPEEEAYRASRSAALHTIDAEQAHSKFAQNVVRDFRRGIYYPVVDFHAGKVSDWLEQRLSAAEPRLLSHVILDLPSAHKEFALAEKAMQTAGSLLVFAPSITQLADCVRTVREERLGLVLERVLEVGTGMAGGREWDLREVRVRPPRSERRPKAVVGGEEAFASETEAVEVQDEKRGSSAEGSEAEAEIGSEGQTDASSVLAASDVAAEIKQGRREMVCRPKVGIRTSGGGFIGVWRKMRHKEDSAV